MSSTAETTYTAPRILLFMPGIKHFQQEFWDQAIVQTGLAPFVDHGKQINALSSELYPEEVLELYNENIAEKFYDWTRWRMDDDWIPGGEKYSHLMIDTEPQKRNLVGVDSAWGWMKMLNGYDNFDYEYLNQMVKGAREATGLPIGHYRTPVLPRLAIDESSDHIFESVKPITDIVDWVWQDEYSDRIITVSNAIEALERQVTHRYALRKLGKPVWNAIWPGRKIPLSQVVNRFEHVLWSSKRWQDEYIIVWVDLDTPGDLMVHTQNMIELAPKFLEVIGGNG